MAKRGRVDQNQQEVVKMVRAYGASVQSIADVGSGVPDLLVGYRGLNILFEVKDGAKPPSARKLTDAQRPWHKKWKGQVAVVNSGYEAIRVLQKVDQEQTVLVQAMGYITALEQEIDLLSEEGDDL